MEESRRLKRVRLLLLVVLAVVATIRAASPLTTTVVLGHSMEPTIHPGAICVLDTSYYCSHPLHRGDVVVLRHGGDTYIKRVCALPGDRLTLLKYQDGGSDELVDSTYAARIRQAHQHGALTDRWISSIRLTKGQCFVLGDNEEL